MFFLASVAAAGGAAGGEPAHAMVVASHRLAAEAGLQMLQAGGSAADAAVATLMVLGVVEPQCAGLGGGAVLLQFDALSQTVAAWDGRETAPAAARAGSAGDPPRTGGRAVGVPGAVRMLEALHHARGRLPWADLLAPAIRLAERGVTVTPDLAGAIAGAQAALRRQSGTLGVFFSPDGAPLPAGSLFVNPALAQTLRAIAAAGANGLLRGPVAAEIASSVRGDEQAGLVTTDDLAAYAPRRSDAVCLAYAGHQVCGPPPPAGGVALLETLGLLARTGFAAEDPAGAEAAALQIEAEEIALADRSAHPGEGTPAAADADLLGAAYLDARARPIEVHPAPDAAGAVAGGAAGAWPAGADEGATSVAILDHEGNAITMIAGLGGAFGSGLFVRGFPLNAALADFADAAAPPGANQMEPGKRPASAFAPAIVLDGARGLRAVAGQTGACGPAGAVMALAALLDWHMEPLRALAAPHVAGCAGGAALEADTPAAGLAPALAAAGLAVTAAPMRSRGALIAVTPRGPAGAADPRGLGWVAAD